MKFKFILLICLLQVSFAQSEPPNGYLVATIMIKNEAHSIEDTLEPLVKAGIDAFLIFDTGSTDDTVEIVENYFKKYPHVTGVVKQEPFVDFAISRNRGLELAKEAFPEAEFLFMLDAEWMLHNGEKLVDFCRQEIENKSIIPSYLVRIIGHNLDFYSTRLTRTKSSCQYVGRIHEVIVPTTNEKVPSEVYFELRYYEAGAAKSRERWKRDRQLLEQSYEENPQDSRSLFYLAQTCHCLDDFESAYRYYKLRKDLPGWPEEDFMTIYRLAQVSEALAKENPDKMHEAVSLYLEAYQFRPNRAEPLIQLGKIYLDRGQHALSFLFAKKAYEMEYPEHDILFVEKYAYDFTRHDILNQCAWYVDEREIGYEALKKALEQQPDAPHLHFNFDLYRKHFQEAKAS